MSQSLNANRKQKRAAKRNTCGIDNQTSMKSTGNFVLNAVFPKPYTRQTEAFDLWDAGKNVVLYGFPGTGKSFLGLFFGLREVVEGNQNKVLIIRSAVPSRDVGFMPGSKKQKAEVYESPYVNICSELFGRGDAYNILKQKGIIDFEITSYLRGLTLDNTILVIDEFQSMNEHELYTVLSRVGDNSRVILCGDIGQNDLTKEKSGFPTMMRVFDRMKDMAGVEFGINDIVRSGFVKSLIVARESLKNDNISAQTAVYA